MSRNPHFLCKHDFVIELKQDVRLIVVISESVQYIGQAAWEL